MKRFLTPIEGMGWSDDDVCRYARAGICNPPHKDMVSPTSTEDPATWNWDTEIGRSLKYNKPAYFCGYSTAPEDCDSEEVSRQTGFFEEYGAPQIENGVECRAYAGDSTRIRIDHPCLPSPYGADTPYESTRGEVLNGEFSMGSRIVVNHPHFP